MTNLLLHESVRQSVSNATKALKARGRNRQILAIVGFGLCALAGAAAAGFSVNAAAGAYVMVGAGIVGAILLFVGYLTERRLQALDVTVCDSLDAIAVARAMANENGAPATEQGELARRFRELDAARLRDVYGRSRSVLYSRQNVRTAERRQSQSAGVQRDPEKETRR